MRSRAEGIRQPSFHWLLFVIVGGSGDAGRAALIIVPGAFIVSLFTAFRLAAAVYVPRNPKAGKSNVFFEDIAAMEYTDFETAARNMSSDVIERQLVDRICRISQAPTSR